MNKVLKALGIAVLALVVVIGLGTIVHAAASGGIFPLKNGWSFGADSDYVTFFGGTPVQRQSLTNTVATLGTSTFSGGTATLTITPMTRTFLDSNGVSIVCWTGATLSVSTVITNVSGQTGSIAGFASTNQANQIITAIRNLNLAN